MDYYVDISRDAVKIDSYVATEGLVNCAIDFDLGSYSFTSVGYDTFASWYIQNNKQ